MSAQAKPISEVVKDFEQFLETLRPSTRRVYVAGDLAFLGFPMRRRTQEFGIGEDSAALQNWVIQRLAKQMRSEKNPSIATRRDSGLIAALCAAPARGTPRKWPESCLKIEGREVLLWDTSIQKNHASLSPCASGMPGESGWPGQINGGYTANLFNRANHNSFSRGPTAPP